MHVKKALLALIAVLALLIVVSLAAFAQERQLGRVISINSHTSSGVTSVYTPAPGGKGVGRWSRGVSHNSAEETEIQVCDRIYTVDSNKHFHVGEE